MAQWNGSLCKAWCINTTRHRQCQVHWGDFVHTWWHGVVPFQPVGREAQVPLDHRDFFLFKCAYLCIRHLPSFLVGLSAGLHKNHSADFYETWVEDGSQLRKDPYWHLLQIWIKGKIQDFFFLLISCFWDGCFFNIFEWWWWWWEWCMDPNLKKSG